MARDELIEALRETSEQLEVALSRLGVCGPGDGQGRRADVSSWGGTTTLANNRALLKKLASRATFGSTCSMLRQLFSEANMDNNQGGEGNSQIQKLESDRARLMAYMTALLNRNLTYLPDGGVILQFENHDQAMNHIQDARDILLELNKK